MNTTTIKTHVLNLDVGDRFCFEPGGPVFRRVVGPDKMIWIVDDAEKLPVHKLDYQSCFVYAIDPFQTFSDGDRLE
jgi:hypothetical protein